MTPCDYCGTPVDSEIHAEEFGMCLDCSNEYWAHDHTGCSWGCVIEFQANLGRNRK